MINSLTPKELYEQRESLRRPTLSVSDIDEILYKKIFQRQREQALLAAKNPRKHVKNCLRRRFENPFDGALFEGKVICQQDHIISRERGELSLSREEWVFLKKFFQFISFDYKKAFQVRLSRIEYWIMLDDVEIVRLYLSKGHIFHWYHVEVRSPEMMELLLSYDSQADLRELIFNVIPRDNTEMTDYFKRLMWTNGTFSHDDLFKFNHLSTIKAFFPYPNYPTFKDLLHTYIRENRDKYFSLWKSVISDEPVRLPYLRDFNLEVEKELFVEAVVYLDPSFLVSRENGDAEELIYVFSQYFDKGWDGYLLAMKALLKRGIDPSVGNYDSSRWKDCLDEEKYQYCLKKMTKVLGPSVMPPT